MKVICDNCRAVYKIPDEKLVKPVNKATCRQCGHRMLIPRPRVDADPDERTLVTAVPPTPAPAPPRTAFDDDPPTNPMGKDPAAENFAKDVELYTVTPAPARSERKKTPSKPSPASTQETRPAKALGHDPAGDLSIAVFGLLLVLFGAVIIAFTPPPAACSLQPCCRTSALALAVASGGGALALFIVATSGRGRKPANLIVSSGAAVFAVVLGFFLWPRLC